jgi:hypothetical protein
MPRNIIFVISLLCLGLKSKPSKEATAAGGKLNSALLATNFCWYFV